MQSGKDADIRVRISQDLKDELETAAEADEDTDTLSEWARRELRAGLRIQQQKNSD